MSARTNVLRVSRAAGAVIGYGSLAVFLYLISAQIYHWFRDGEWTHVGTSDGLRLGLLRCCVKDGDSGALAQFVQWLESPVDWLGMHKVIEIVPASLALFAVSIAGNCMYIYAKDKLDQR